MTYEERRASSRQNDAELDAALDELGVDLNPSPEWRVVMALLRGAWPGEVSKSDQLAYLTVLNDLPERDVARAIRELARGDQKFRPTPGEIRSQLEIKGDESAVLTFDEAWALIEQAGASSSYKAISALESLREGNAALGAWAELRGLARLWREPVNDPEHGRLVLRDLRASYEQHLSAWAKPQRRSIMMRRGAGKLASMSSSSMLDAIGDGSQREAT